MTSDASSGVDARSNPWLSMWFRPQTTIKRIVQNDPTRYVLILAMLAGISGILFQAWSLPGVSVEAAMRHGSSLLHLPIFALLVAAGSILGIVGLHLNAVFVALSGKPLGGRASLRDLRAALAWSQLPQVLALAIMLVLVVLYHFEGPLSAGNEGWLYLTIVIGAVVVGLLSL